MNNSKEPNVQVYIPLPLVIALPDLAVEIQSIIVEQDADHGIDWYADSKTSTQTCLTSDCTQIHFFFSQARVPCQL